MALKKKCLQCDGNRFCMVHLANAPAVKPGYMDDPIEIGAYVCLGCGDVIFRIDQQADLATIEKVGMERRMMIEVKE